MNPVILHFQRWARLALWSAFFAQGCASYPEPTVRFREEPTRARQVWQVGTSAKATPIAFFPDGKRFLVVTADEAVSVWTVGRAAPDRTLNAERKLVTGLDLSPDGEWIAIAFNETKTESGPIRVQLHSTRDGATREQEIGQAGRARVAFFPDSRRLAVRSDVRDALTHELSVWTVPSLERTWKVQMPSPSSSSLFVVPGERGVRIVAGYHWFEERGAEFVHRGVMEDPPELVTHDGEAFWGVFESTLIETLETRESGISKGPLGSAPTSFLVLRGDGARAYPSPQAYLPARRAGGAGQLLVSLLRNSRTPRVVWVNLDTKRYEVLTRGRSDNENHSAILSPDGRLVVVGAPMGMSAWQVPGE